MNRLLLFSLWLTPLIGIAQSSPQKRIAFVVGNAHYEQSALDNSVNDARLMTIALQKLGFDVYEYEDCDRETLRAAIGDFSKKLKEDKAATGLFYYSGHGVQAGGRNYLIPVDAVAQNEAGLEASTVNLDVLMQGFAEAGNMANIVILDACRTNPFEGNVPAAPNNQPGAKRTDDFTAQKSAPAGTFIAFSTAPECNAGDGTRGVGLYTQELMEAMQTPAAPIESVFKKVRTQVKELSEGKQIPWEHSSLETDFYFIPPGGGLSPGVVQHADFWRRDDFPQLHYISFSRKERSVFQVLAPIALRPFTEIY